jgi:beta-lactamase class A
MTARIGPALAVTLVLLPALLIACGGSASEPEPTATPTSTAVRPAPTGTPTLASPSEGVIPTPQVESVGDGSCPDPYPGGAPYEPTPGAPIRLRPAGSPPALSSYRPLTLVHDPALERVVRQSIGGEGEHFGVVVKNLADGHGAALNADRRFYAASLFKTWVMLEAFHQQDAGLLDISERYVVSDYYDRFRLNQGELTPCQQVTVGEALARMMSVSDNVAANLLLDLVGPANVNAALRGLSLTISGFFQDDSLPVTATDMALLLEAVARRQAVSAAASDEMLALLGTESIDDRLPALLPAGTQVAHKTGSWPTATHDAGIVFSPEATYIIVVLTDFDFRKGGAERIAQLSQAVYEYYNGS